MDQFGSWAKVVIVEDDVGLAEIYKTRLELIGYICFVAPDGIEGLTVIEKERPSLVLLDLMIPKLSGDQLLKTIRMTEWGKDVKVFVISNLNESEAPQGLRDHGIVGYIVKANMSNDQIDQIVNSILRPDPETEKNTNEDYAPADGQHDQ